MLAGFGVPTVEAASVIVIMVADPRFGHSR
ncbi:hypothetical protein JOD64_003906 [Micromonospora luteifusca]|uniref:Uncharacterized protein n=1 Tax=Micromonospora luteifusca TaxID=709860 RepID=A0ABS2LXU7_9ACTN|nr:hypothetical protein [Micromonospora luteifusca]